MSLDQADVNSQPVDSSVDRSYDKQENDLSRSIWDDLKESAANACKAAEKAAGTGNYLDLTNSNIYGSVHDFNPSMAADILRTAEVGKPLAISTDVVAFARTSNPADARPADAPVGDPPKPVDNTKPIDTKPADTTKPVDNPRPVEAGKPGDGKPAPGKDAEGAAPKDVIMKDVEPKEYEVKRGDNLTKIAKAQLGPDATPQEIHQYIKEVAKLNKIKNPDLILDGQKLQLPGHTKDGGYITLDGDGNKTTTWKDGREKFESKDGTTGWERTPDGTGGYTEKHFGTNPTDNYEMHVYADTTVVVTDHKGNKETFSPNGDYKKENTDGTAYTRTQGADGKFSEHHTGPNPEDNYDLTQQADGSYKGKDAAGNTHTKWDDGREQVDYPDGRGYLRTPAADGGYTEKHWGTRPEQNYENKVDANGKVVEVREKPTDAPHSQLDGADVQAQREKLEKLAESKIHDDGELAKFKADMQRFEDRMKTMEETYKKQGLSPEEAHKKAQEQTAKTFENISRLMEAKDNPATGVDETKRMVLAEQIMSQAATPTSIDQGSHPTCNVTTVESRTYTTNPAEASKLVVDVATTGEYVCKDGKHIKVDAGSMVPYDAAETNPPKDGGRSYASQIFQVTAVNIHYQKDGDWRYEQHKPDYTAKPPDNGERLMDYSETPPKEMELSLWEEYIEGREESELHAPGLSDEEIVDIDTELNGEQKSWYIRHGEDGDDGKVSEVESEKELQDKIAQAKAEGKLPIVVKVHTGNEPFYTDSGAGAAGGSGGWHVVTIRDYQEGPPAMVKIDNQWGSSVDHNTDSSMVSVHDLYQTMRDSKSDDTIEEVQKDVDYNREKGIVDDYKELELLRLKRQNGDLDEDEYKEAIAERIKEMGKHPDDAGRQRAMKKLDALVHNLSYSERLEMLHLEKQNGLKDDATYDAWVQWEFVNAERDRLTAIKDDKYDDDKEEEYEKTVAELKKIMDEMPEDRKVKMQNHIKSEKEQIEKKLAEKK